MFDVNNYVYPMDLDDDPGYGQSELLDNPWGCTGNPCICDLRDR